MTNTVVIVIRTIFVMFLAILLIAEFSGLVYKFTGRNRTEDLPRTPKPRNPGYGDSNPDIIIDADIEDDSIKYINVQATRTQILQTIKNACLPKLICELNATPEKEKLTDSERSLLSLLRDTSISITAELTSKYHFAAHMGQLIAGVDGNGCHNFYPTCPFPGLQVLQMMKKVRMR